MLVTVVLPVYNGGATVTAAVDSIVKQTYPDWEMVIVDDGSSDDTGEIIQRLAEIDSRIKLLPNPRNLGLPASLNRAIAFGKGELIARMDADDVSLPKRLERQVAFLQEHPEVAVLGTAARLVDEAGVVLGDHFRPERHEELARRMYREVPFMHPTVMGRKSFFEALGGYDENVRGAAEDADLWLRGYRRYRYHNLPEVLLTYTVPLHQSFRAAALSAFVLSRGALREGRYSKVWYGGRWILGWILIRMGIVHPYRYPVTPP